MALDLLRPLDSPNPKILDSLIGERYNIELSHSIKLLLTENGNEHTKIAQFLQKFYELMQARVDPPLESIWVCAALTFRSRNDPKDEPLDRISAARNVFQLISSCSSPCDSSKSIALLAPVVYEVYRVAVVLFGKGLNSKREKKAMREVMSLAKVVLEYISVCSSKGDESNGSNLVAHFSDLVHIWAGSDVGLESFLPLVSGEVCRRVGEEGCDVGYLAGVVVLEAFLLTLYLNFGSGISREDLEKELKSWAVGSITGFDNFYFFEALLRMLLEKSLPLLFLSSSGDEVLLRKVLYDAVILVDYSFLNPERTLHLPADQVRSLAMARLILTHKAVEYFREHGDHRRAISHTNSFSNSSLAAQIIKWIRKQIHVEENDSKVYGSSPKALIKWLMKLENQGLRVFDDGILKSHAKLACDTPKSDFEQPASKLESTKMDDDLLCYIDNKGEELDGHEENERMNEAMTAAFVAAAHSMKSVDNGGKKRKERRSAEKKRKIKFLKYDTLRNLESLSGRSPVVSYDGVSSGSEVESPLSDEDTEQNKQ